MWSVVEQSVGRSVRRRSVGGCSRGWGSGDRVGVWEGVRRGGVRGCGGFLFCSRGWGVEVAECGA